MRLVIPYVIWSLIYVIIDIVFLGERISIFKLLKRIGGGGCQIQMYFIVVLIQMLFITPLTVFLYKKCKAWKYVFFALTPLYFVASYVLKIKFETDIPLKTVLFPAWFLFYWSGIYCNLAKKDYLFNLKFSPVVLCVVLSCAEGAFWGKLEMYDMAVSQLKITSCLLSVAVINLILIFKDKISVSDKNIFVHSGNISYGIYYVHMIGIMISKHFASAWNITDIMPLPIIQLLQLIFVLGTSVLMIEFTKRVIGKGPANKLLGF